MLRNLLSALRNPFDRSCLEINNHTERITEFCRDLANGGDAHVVFLYQFHGVNASCVSLLYEFVRIGGHGVVIDWMGVIWLRRCEWLRLMPRVSWTIKVLLDELTRISFVVHRDGLFKDKIHIEFYRWSYECTQSYRAHCSFLPLDFLPLDFFCNVRISQEHDSCGGYPFMVRTNRWQSLMGSLSLLFSGVHV